VIKSRFECVQLAIGICPSLQRCYLGLPAPFRRAVYRRFIDVVRGIISTVYQWDVSCNSIVARVETIRVDRGAGRRAEPLSDRVNSKSPTVRITTKVMPFLSLEQRCGMACQAMLRRPRRCRCSRTGRRHTSSAAATKLFDFNDISLVIISPPEQWSLQ